MRNILCQSMPDKFYWKHWSHCRKQVVCNGKINGIIFLCHDRIVYVNKVIQTLKMIHVCVNFLYHSLQMLQARPVRARPSVLVLNRRPWMSPIPPPTPPPTSLPPLTLPPTSLNSLSLPPLSTVCPYHLSQLSQLFLPPSSLTSLFLPPLSNLFLSLLSQSSLLPQGRIQKLQREGGGGGFTEVKAGHVLVSTMISSLSNKLLNITNYTN